MEFTEWVKDNVVIAEEHCYPAIYDEDGYINPKEGVSADTGDREYKCLECGEKFIFTTDLRTHFILEHA